MQQIIQRLRPWLIGAAALTLTLLPQNAQAATSIRTMLDGRELTFAIAPFIEDGRTIVQARRLLESMGATVDWEQSTRTVVAHLGNREVRAPIGSRTALVNGQAVTMDVPPRIVNDSTLIPLRFFVENLGISVTWEQETRTIYIDSNRTVVSRDGSNSGREAVASPGPSQVVAEARRLVGTRYTWGGTSPQTGFDCSGFIYYLGKVYGLELPRTSYEQFQVGVPVARGNLAPGDLVFFSTYASGPSHVGIYMGGGDFINAQSSATGVKIASLESWYWSSRYVGARRVFR